MWYLLVIAIQPPSLKIRMTQLIVVFVAFSYSIFPWELYRWKINVYYVLFWMKIVQICQEMRSK